MKLRTYMLIANAASICIILASLFVCYRYMLLTWDEVKLLGGVTIGAALVSFAVHFAMTRRLGASMNRLMEETGRVAEGRFEGNVPLSGPQEFRELARRFNAMTAKLSTSFERLRSSETARSELVVSVSHDLRTPMASIISFVEALEDDVIQDRETFDRYLQTIRLETGRLSRLIDELFELSRYRAGGNALSPETCHVDSLILETLQSHALQLEEKRLHVRVDIPERLRPVSVMPYEIKRVLSNLLQNAIRFSPEDGELAIVAEEEPETGFTRITVTDQGEGVAPEELGLIFERFYRADKSRNRKSGGAGLGLAIAKSIVELHGGTIGAQNRAEGGSLFYFTVPQDSAEGRVRNL